MDCYTTTKTNTSPFVHPATSLSDHCPTSCPNSKIKSHCYWDEALLECLQDFSNHNNPTSEGDSGFRVNTATSSMGATANTSSSTATTNTTLMGTVVGGTYNAYNNISNNIDNQHQTNNNTSYYDYEEEGYGGHAALHYEDLEDAGPPARPQEFPTPIVHEGIRATIRAMDHRTHNVRVVKNVLMLSLEAYTAGVGGGSSSSMDDPAALLLQNLIMTGVANPNNIVDRAYLLKKKIRKSSYGNCYLSVALQRRKKRQRSTTADTATTSTIVTGVANDEKRPDDHHDDEKDNEYDPNYDDDDETVEWESTEEFVTVTVTPWTDAMRRHRRSLSQKREGPVHAIAAMQHVGNYHPHVMGSIVVFSDSQHLYTVAPFHGGIDLQTKIVAHRESGAFHNNKLGTTNESEARVIFRQLLGGLFHLQRKGVCHSNLSLENVYIDRNNQNLVIVDLGRSFRVPYNDPSNFGCLIGETEGTTRRLLQLLPQDYGSHPTANLMFLPPEIVENEDAFDGFAADLWAAGCILFVLLVGMAPFKTAHYWDAAYAEISSGNLKGLLGSLNIHLSEEATGLLQNMFWRDPRDRLTLAQILDHAWVKNQRFPAVTISMSRPSVTSTTSTVGTGVVSFNGDADSASTASSLATDKSGDRARLSSGSRKSLSKAISGLFGGAGAGNGGSSKDSTPKRDGNHTKVGSWSMGQFMSNSNPSSSSKRGRRRKSFGGLSIAALDATNTTPTSVKSLSQPAEEEKQDAFGFQVLQLPNL